MGDDAICWATTCCCAVCCAVVAEMGGVAGAEAVGAGAVSGLLFVAIAHPHQSVGWATEFRNPMCPCPTAESASLSVGVWNLRDVFAWLSFALVVVHLGVSNLKASWLTSNLNRLGLWRAQRSRQSQPPHRSV